MQGLAKTGPEEQARGSGRRRDLLLVSLLLVLSTAICAREVHCTKVPARDSIGFIRYVLRLEEFGWIATVRQEHQHPGYPLTILAVSLPVRHFLGMDCDTMELSAQLASSLAGLLLVIPMFYMGKYLVDRRAGFWGAFLFQCLPATGRALSDALSDPLFMLLLAASLACAMRAVRDRAPAFFALAGAWCGLAYLTRPEGALVLPATGLVVLIAQFVPSWRQPWRGALASAGAMMLGALAAGSPYYLTTGRFTNKPSGTIVATGNFRGGAADPESSESTPAPATAAAIPATHPPSPGPQVGGNEQVLRHREKPLLRRMGQGAWVLAGEFAQCYQYVGWLPVVVGLWWCRRRYQVAPEVWIVTLLFVLDALLLWLLVVRAGYLSGRHVLVLVMCSIFQASAVLAEAPYRLAAWRRRPSTGWSPWYSPAAWSLAVLLVVASVGLSRTLQPPPANRLGNRAAGHWLAAHTEPSDTIDDDHCWAHYYANRVFQETSAVVTPPGYQPKHYVVVNGGNDKKSSGRSSPVSVTELQRRGGQVVYAWPEAAPVERAQVVVYLVP